MTDFLKDRKQSVILHDQHSSWADVKARVPQGSILRLLLFLLYVNNLLDDVASNPKLFADNTSLFSIVKNIDNTGIDLNKNLRIVNKLALQWKISFSPDPAKQAQQVIASCNIIKANNPLLFFKSYLCYKMILSQNVPSEAQVKNFLFHRKVMFHSQDIQVFLFLTIPWFTKSVTS